jgi:DNA-binding Lrp family transcriptional regulator
MSLKPTEQKLIRELQRDSRQTLRALSRKAKLPMSTIHDKLKEWRRKGLIRRFTIQVDHAALGKYAQAIVFLRVPRQQRDRLYETLASRPEIESFYRINNGWDYLAHVAAKDYLTVEAFLEELDSTHAVQAKEAHYLLEEGVKREPPKAA